MEVFNQAGLPAETLARAKGDMTRIYADIGVAIVWTDSAGKDRRFVVHLIIRARPPRPGVMGTAFGDSRDTGGTAFVYRDRVRDVARGGDLDTARVLAYGMAHEIGHMVLPAHSHSDIGIMRAVMDLSSTPQRFTRDEAVVIRATVAADLVFIFASTESSGFG